MKILWLTNIPSPYRVDFFNELGKWCELTVLFEKKASDERDESWKNFNINNFVPIFMKGKNIGVAEAFCLEVISYLKKGCFDCCIITNFSDPTGILAITILKARKIPYIVESDGGFAGSGKGMKEKLKKWLLSGADKCFSTSKEHDNYYMTYGVKRENLIRYPFTSLHVTDILRTPVTDEQKKELRSQLHMPEERIILAVGQFIYRKGYDILLRAVSQINCNIGCYIVGGKASKDYEDLIEELKLTNVHFLDFQNKENLDKYYMATDVFVHPTREDIWGLVINEAMAKGVPVVTTNKCIAGLELIRKSNVGRIVPTENPTALRIAIEELLAFDSYRGSCEVLDAIQDYTVENMAAIHLRVLEE